MEDDQSKARRNLVMFSVGVISVWFLQIPLDGKLIGVGDLKGVDPDRAWLGVLAVLGYLFLRFHLSIDVGKARQEWRQHFKVEFGDQLKHLASSAYHKRLADRKACLTATLHSPDPPTTDIEWRPGRATRVELQRGAPKSVSITSNWVSPDPALNQYIGTSANHLVNFRRLGRALVVVRSCWRATVINWRALEIGAPYLMASFAVGVAIHNLVTTRLIALITG